MSENINIKTIRSMLHKALRADRTAVQRELNRISRDARDNRLDEKVQKKLAGIKKRLDRSIQKRLQREKNLPKLTYNKDLPITAKKEEIIDAIVKNRVVIISGETGSGKTTQIPKFCLEAGRGIEGLIGCTQPRRIAATSVARRIAEELESEVGEHVGYKIRFQDRTGKKPYIKLMTDGILLTEAQSDRRLEKYDTIIVDEAHERSLNIDFILGLLRRLIQTRKDLKIIITSATIDTEKFSKAFNHAPIIEVSGRMYPVEVRHFLSGREAERPDESNHVEMAVHAVDQVMSEGNFGDLLVFMPTEQDIRETCALIEGRAYKGVKVFPLFARLSSSRQTRIFSNIRGRKIVVATNIAETSITIPGIRYVIDSGLARISRYNPRARTTALPVSAISRSSADQRMGRCGRVENGICIRLFSEDDYENRAVFTLPEILRANLAEVILRMIALKLGDVEAFPFIDKPASKSIADGFRLLTELGAIAVTSRKGKSAAKQYLLTEKGKLMARMPIDPRLSRMLIEADKEGCIDDILIIASALSISDPRERPAEKTQKADEAQKTFADPASDFITLMNIWKQYHAVKSKEKPTRSLKNFCISHFLSFRRMREWIDLHAQLSTIFREYIKGLDNGGLHSEKGVKNRKAFDGKRRVKKNHGFPDEYSDRYRSIHRSILSGFLSNIAIKKEKNLFQAAKGKDVMVFPGSALFNKAGNWIVAAEMVETSRLFARIVANIDSNWLESLAGDQCKNSYLHPHWEKNRGEVIASEQVSLYGLVIVPERPVSYGRINPDEASEIFVREGLVPGDMKEKFPFLDHNLALVGNIRDSEDRIRKRDILVSDEEMFLFYRNRLDPIYDGRTLARMIRKRGDDKFLWMKKDDLMEYDPDEEELALYPGSVDLDGKSYTCRYVFDPEKPDDGLTISIPAPDTSGVPIDSVDWLVPGLYRDKITALIKGLPKKYRKKLVPVAGTVRIIQDEMPKEKKSLLTSLSSFIYRRFGIDIPATEWPEDLLPDYLKARLSITDTNGKELLSSRDKNVLRNKVFTNTGGKEFDAAKKEWERSNITKWDMERIPDSILLKNVTGKEWSVYPGLVARENHADLRLFRNKEEALQSHKTGVAKIYTLVFSKDLKFLRKSIVLPQKVLPIPAGFGKAKGFEKRIVESIVGGLFSLNIRDADAFNRHGESVKHEMMERGRRLFQCSIDVLTAYNRTMSELAGTERSLAGSGLMDELKDSVKRLVPVNFLDLYTETRLVHIQRYLKAVSLRAKKASVNLEKERERQAEVAVYSNSLKELLGDLSALSSEEKKSAVEDYFWMIEEFKVSVFAQELKTAVPVSKKRLDKMLGDIKRMI